MDKAEQLRSDIAEVFLLICNLSRLVRLQQAVV